MIMHHMSTCAEKSVASRFWIGDRLRQGDALVTLNKILAVLPAAKCVVRVHTIQLKRGHNSGLLMMMMMMMQECRSLDGGLASRSASNSWTLIHSQRICNQVTCQNGLYLSVHQQIVRQSDSLARHIFKITVHQRIISAVTLLFHDTYRNHQILQFKCLHACI